jgi:DNA replication protein DnaC
VRAHELLEDLRRGQAERRLERRLRIYVAAKLLIIDEFGVWPYDRMAATASLRSSPRATNAAASS